MIVELLNRFEPEPEGLLREISKHVSDEMLSKIAAADYGMGQEEHLSALRQIRDTGMFPQNMVWYPMEVLELTRNFIPNLPDCVPGEPVESVYWMEAFSCVSLLRASCKPWNYFDAGSNTTVIHLILRLRELPVDFTPLAVKFLAWLLIHSEPEGGNDSICAYGIGLLWFALHLAQPVADEDLIFLSKWIVRRAEELYLKPYPGRDPYLCRLGVGNPPPSPWAFLGTALSDLDLSGRSPELREWVGLIGQELAG